ncbi:MAG: NUDIX hydrolase [Nitrospirae bacterium]|nr:NUDIX hydrolase [Nitrospirota bacterium]
MELISKKIKCEGRFIRMMDLSYKDHRGNLRNWEAVERVNCDGVTVVVPVTNKGELLLIRQFRPVLNNYVVEFPAGLNEKDESPLVAAKRELIEETGYTADDFIKLADGPVSSGMSTETLHVLLAKEVYPASEKVKALHPPDETENIEIILTPFEKAFETISDYSSRGDLIDLKIYGFVELAKRYL